METEELKNRMQELQKQFEEVNQKIDETVNLYNQKIIELQKEGQDIVENLQMEREQIRGAYTENYNRLQKISGKKVEEESTVQVEEPKIEKEKIGEVAIGQVQMEDVKTENITDLDKKEILSEQEITNLEKVITPHKDEKPDNIKEEDIPDYLKEEYKDKK